MYLKLVKTDFITAEGELNTLTLEPNTAEHIRVDRAAEFRDLQSVKNKVVGGTVIYNLDECELKDPARKIMSLFHSNSNEISFTYDHKNIPLGKEVWEKGIWNLILPQGWRLTELHVVCPYRPKNAKSIEERRSFQYTVTWDQINQMQLVEMELSTGRKERTFSFIVSGKACKVDSAPITQQYIPSQIKDNIDLKYITHIPSNKRNKLFKQLNSFLGILQITINLDGSISLNKK
ncbi:hypothetical protein H7F28_14510 [Brevibacterium sp. PAMC23299]|nr:hypothetical protein H7F28_14510 [Brevibacterium sp. PAMC23299]